MQIDSKWEHSPNQNWNRGRKKHSSQGTRPWVSSCFSVEQSNILAVFTIPQCHLGEPPKLPQQHHGSWKSRIPNVNHSYSLTIFWALELSSSAHCRAGSWVEPRDKTAAVERMPHKAGLTSPPFTNQTWQCQWETPELSGDLNGKVMYKWRIFHWHVWLLEGKHVAFEQDIMYSPHDVPDVIQIELFTNQTEESPVRERETPAGGFLKLGYPEIIQVMDDHDPWIFQAMVMGCYGVPHNQGSTSRGVTLSMDWF